MKINAFIAALAVVVLVLTLTVSVLAEGEPAEEPTVETATDIEPATDAQSTATRKGKDTKTRETRQSSEAQQAPQETRKAYRDMKRAEWLAQYEAELKAMVEAGQLTEEQADLLLKAAREKTQKKTGTEATDMQGTDESQTPAAKTTPNRNMNNKHSNSQAPGRNRPQGGNRR